MAAFIHRSQVEGKHLGNASFLLHGGTLAWRGELGEVEERGAGCIFMGQALDFVGQLLSWASPTQDPQSCTNHVGSRGSTQRSPPAS
jgi:hypothetical protein